MTNKNRLPIAAALSLAFSGAALAQQAAPGGSTALANSAAGAALIQDVVVTGTRDTTRSAGQSLSPIDVIGAKELQRTGATDLRDALVKLLPSVSRLAIAGDAANLTSALTLRGLSPNHVLLLINGKRRHTSANISADPGSQQGSTPVDIDLIPVSAVDHIEVLRDGAAAQYGSDAIAGVINVILKSSSSGGTLTGTSGRYYKRDGLTVGAAADTGLALGADGFLHLSAEFRRHEHSVRSGPDERTGTYANRIVGDPASKRTSVAANAGYDLGGDIELYAFATAAHRAGATVQNYRLPSRLPAVHPDGFSPVETSNENDGSLTAGARGGSTGAWRWDASVSYGIDNVNIGMEDSANVDLYVATGSTPTSFHLARYRNSHIAANGDVSRAFDTGVLPAALQVALGAEYRRETYEVGPGDAASSFGSGAQALPGLSDISAGKHTRNIGAAYADLTTRFTPQWEAALATRYEHYSDAGSTTNAKLSSRYEFTKKAALRGTVGTGFRAPSLAQENYTSLMVSPTTAGGQLAVNSPAARTLGAQSLKPEKSRSINVGFVAEPVDRLHVTVDAYRIRIRDRIIQGGTYTGQRAVDALRTAGITLPTGLISVSASYFANGVDTRTEGVDFVLNYTTPLGGGGRIDWDAAANINNTKVERIAFDTNGNPLLNAQQVSWITSTSPKNKLIVGGVWTRDQWSVSLHASRYGKTSSEATLYKGPDAYSTTVFQHVENAPKTLTDLEVRWQATPRWQVALGAQNLFDETPTEMPAETRYLGVYRFNNQAAQIGFNGGYYYARASYKF
ncbi:TonB-dependent receptor plug domain-containing protein [Pseudoduganella umbonata]|uniref:Iron complex outermembrane receptor protein n=1 Tax=Pseudoduganella umbonata TaxID=864828 RepID=A0A4P8HM49_9BURK|nr:TonB-dependent receptor [Pseudoduganella umbonata]MBB3220029.1 iron complex outermembrane receptor protein [Pseudoduganella umbonata]QCP10036.1 TonB-dependent receptor [Pseudoduganella umbonata]